MAAVGRKREAWRIREFLDGLGMCMADVARDLGLSRNLVGETVKGARNNKKVLDYLRELGCPEKWLDLPEAVKARKAA
ncbi:hypothetical protein NNJEOMEG_02602 [Fundidesulfovibrio magnetotacticus]|uniref:Uncharacterized protein n=1 Tax=Fundidesulfovibrio magnetotacticus TaxID=2730080 RepID=A0A6V8M2T6_9BACT|nr:hypothetical protein [Fundidesulfovibrio magnetotacticus]GFK94755.1 hypothetical protein NNJEOMEG_02602 [Fundidesulfovibrio magnetotacticus]